MKNILSVINVSKLVDLHDLFYFRSLFNFSEVKKTDLKYLLETTGENREIIIELIDIFIDQVSEFNEEFRNLNKLKDFDALGKLAHKAKSSVAIMGMEKLSEKLKEFEILALEGINPEKYPGYINYFMEECAVATKELNDYKDDMQN